jgi:hypothetical protein
MLVVGLLGVLLWLIAVLGLPAGLGGNVAVPAGVRQAALDLGSQVATSARSVMPLGSDLSRPAEPAGPHPHIVPEAGKAVRAKAIKFTFNGTKYTVTPHVASPVYHGAKKSTRLLVQMPSQEDDEWTRTYYRAFASDPAQTPAIDDVCRQLQAIRSKADLDSDQYLELIGKYVQSIPYDWELFKSGEGRQRFPVETLVDGKGLCGDKSVLLAVLLAHEGYSAALLDFGPEKHMAAAISGPGETYASSGMLFWETTAPCYVTDVPATYAGGMTLTSEPTVIRIGSGTGRYTAADQIDNRRSSLGIGGGRDDVARLVQHHMAQLLAGNRLTVDLDAVTGLDHGVESAGPAVDDDAPRLDEVVGRPPRGDAGTCEVCVEPHLAHCRWYGRSPYAPPDARLRRPQPKARRSDRGLRRERPARPDSRSLDVYGQGAAHKRGRPRRLRARGELGGRHRHRSVVQARAPAVCRRRHPGVRPPVDDRPPGVALG